MGARDIALSANFRLGEFLVSEEHKALAAALDPLTGNQVNRLRLLWQSVLQPIRDRWGSYTITSGFRSVRLNEAVRGAK